MEVFSIPKSDEVQRKRLMAGLMYSVGDSKEKQHRKFLLNQQLFAQIEVQRKRKVRTKGSNLASRRPIMVKSTSKRLSSFTIDAILSHDSSCWPDSTNDTTDVVAKHRVDHETSHTPGPLNLNYMQVLGNIRRQRQKFGDSLARMTQCLLCGGCSFSQSKAVAANYMAQHLYTHLTVPIYSCSLCANYTSSWKPRVQNHLKNKHAMVACNSNNSCRYIRDHRNHP